MRDGARLAERDIPSVGYLTEKFAAEGVFVARAAGVPDVPRILLPHPVAGTGTVRLRELAVATAEAAALLLQGGG